MAKQANRSTVLHAEQRDSGPRWSGVEVRAYKTDGSRFRDISRQVLLGPAEGLSVETRYFEIEPGGYSSLERHDHTHSVVVLRGAGTVLLGDRVARIEPLDTVFVAPQTLHQFHADENQSLGFLCIVDTDRDRPAPATPEELRSLIANPELSRWAKT